MQAKTLVALGAALLTIAAPAAAEAADQIAVSAPATALGNVPAAVPVTTTVTADTQGIAITYVQRKAADCAPTAAEMEGRTGAARVDSVSATPGETNEHTSTYTASTPGHYRLCAYLLDGVAAQAGPPRALAEGDAAVGEADRGDDITVAVSGSGPLTYTLRGHSTERPRLVVYVEPDGTDCAPTAGEQGRRPLARSAGALLPGAGAFMITSQAPAPRAGPYRVCAYLQYDADSSDAAPRAVATTTGVRTGGDRDRDGVMDEVDACPDTRGPRPSGCPKIVLEVKPSIKLAARNIFIGLREPVNCKVVVTTTLLGTRLTVSGRAPRPVVLKIPKPLAKRLARKASTKVVLKVTAICGSTTVKATRRTTLKR